MSQIYRAPWHDYRSRCIYMVTLSKNPEIECFGHLAGDASICSGVAGSPYIIHNNIGNAIKTILRNFHEIEPSARVLQYCIMPDHVHILLFIQDNTDETLGSTIARFKVKVNKCSGIQSVFAKGFNDQILKTNRKLDTLFNYIRCNPYRLAVRRAMPDFFRRINNLMIGGKTVQAYGNLQLLDNPFKEQVIVHRADTPEQRYRNRLQWLYTASNGGVLVSPFISPAEKAIRSEAENVNGRFILISAEPFGDRYKPAAHNFELCERGRMLIISDPSVSFSQSISRQQCMTLNELATSVTNFQSK